jgi:carboxypeptidase PM20D1
MQYLGDLLLWVLGVITGLLMVAVVKTLLTKQKVSVYQPSQDEKLNLEYAEKLSEMIKYETVSHPENPEIEKFRGFHKVLEKLFPLVHEKLEKTEIDGNLLYYWKGKSSEKPILLMSHQDVVPAEGEWTHAPFSGDIADGKVWGRGAADVKCGIFAFMQAVEELLQQGYVPECDVYLSSSCTEEWGGQGAPKLVEELKRRGIRLFMVCDEGGAIISNPIGGIHGNFAMVGLFEKGIGNVKFTARSQGGHASAPPLRSPIARLSAFVNDVEKHPPFKRRMSAEVTTMFNRLSAYADFPLRLVLGNTWLFGGILKKVMPFISPQATAMLQTTIAFTMQSGSDAYNVLPQEASVCANMRFIPHQGMEESLQIIRAKAAKYGLEMEVVNANDYSPPVDINGEAFGQIQQVIQMTYPGMGCSPYIVTGGTDARFYHQISDNCIRFSPIVYGPEQMKGMHGLNENIEYNCLPKAVEFFKNLIALQKR